jgi:hypothetical protein
MTTEFVRLNMGWNAEPNAPEPRVWELGADLELTFLLNAFQFGELTEGDLGRLRFRSCWRYRLGHTNDEGWHHGQCRFSGIAPRWGEFYEVLGDLRLAECPQAWTILGDPAPASRHFLFYLRDETFECDATDWSFSIDPRG